MKSVLEEMLLARNETDIIHRFIILMREDPSKKEEVFNYLHQLYQPILIKMSKLIFKYDKLIEKNLPNTPRRLYRKGTYNEAYNATLELFWKAIVDFDPHRGVYFPYYLKQRLEWNLKNIWKKDRNQKKKDKKNKDEKPVTEISYERFCEGFNNDLRDEDLSIVRVAGISFDDNFDLFTFDWALEEPVQFVEDKDLYDVLKTFTTKQTEAYVLELQGYYQEQIAHEIKKKSGASLSQQAVNDRLIGVCKKVEKYARRERGDQYGEEKSKKSAQ